MAKPKVLITGASGLIGGLVIEGLSEKYDFSALNRSKIEGIPLRHCLLYTSPSPRDRTRSRMPSSA